MESVKYDLHETIWSFTTVWYLLKEFEFHDGAHESKSKAWLSTRRSGRRKNVFF